MPRHMAKAILVRFVRADGLGVDAEVVELAMVMTGGAAADVEAIIVLKSVIMLVLSALEGVVLKVFGEANDVVDVKILLSERLGSSASTMSTWWLGKLEELPGASSCISK